MAITEVLDLKFKPESVEPFKEWAKQELVHTRAWEGCEGLTVHSVQDDPTNLVIIGHWTSKESYEGYIAWRTEKGDMAKLGSMLSAEPVLKLTDIVGV